MHNWHDTLMSHSRNHPFSKCFPQSLPCICTSQARPSYAQQIKLLSDETPTAATCKINMIFSQDIIDRVLCSVICEYSHTHWYYSFISLSNASSRWQCCTMISHWDGLHQMPQVSSLFPIKGYSGNTLEMSSHSCHCFWQLSISTRCPRPKHHDHTMMLCWWHNINNTLLLRNRLKYEEQYTAA